MQRLPAALHTPEAVPVRPQERLRRDLLPPRLLLERRLRRSLHPAPALEPVRRLLRAVSRSARGENRRRVQGAPAPAGADARAGRARADPRARAGAERPAMRSTALTTRGGA